MHTEIGIPFKNLIKESRFVAASNGTIEDTRSDPLPASPIDRTIYTVKRTFFVDSRGHTEAVTIGYHKEYPILGLNEESHTKARRYRPRRTYRL